MKKYKLFGMLLLAGILLIAGCGNNDDKVVDGNKDKPLLTTEPEDEGGSLQHGDGYGFTDFELEIDVDGAEAIDLLYKVDEEVEGKYVNKLQDFNLKDEEALNSIRELFTNILITKDTPKDEVKTNILQFLHIDEYSKFDLEIVFDTGEMLEITDSQ